MLALSLMGLVPYYFSLPNRLFNDPYSTVLKGNREDLLSASIAKDGQWRFPKVDTVPKKFSDALITYEDKRFYRHPGVDPLSLCRAMKQNFAGDGRIVSGGSTLTMQVVRLSRKGKPRNSFPKGDRNDLKTYTAGISLLKRRNSGFVCIARAFWWKCRRTGSSVLALFWKQPSRHFMGRGGIVSSLTQRPFVDSSWEKSRSAKGRKKEIGFWTNE